MEIRTFNLSEINWRTDSDKISKLRRQVGRQLTQNDSQAWHWLATDSEEISLACISLSRKGEITFLFVLSDYRHQGIGAALLEQAIEKARHLGMEKVYLESPEVLLDFFRKQNFNKEVSQSKAADISQPLIYMTRQIDPLQTNNQRTLASESTLQVLVRDYDSAEVDWGQNKKLIKILRRQIPFVDLSEGKVSSAEDSESYHFLSKTEEQAIGILSMDSRGQLQGPIVDSNFRHKGVASSLIESAIQKAVRLGIKELTIYSNLEGFLTKIGFDKKTDSDNKYCRKLISDPINRVNTKAQDQSFSSLKHEFSLGQNQDFLLLRRKEDFQNIVVDMAEQAAQTIQIFSPHLDHALFDQGKIRDICSSLARKNKYTKIEILLFDAHRVIKNGHCLLELSRKLPSSISMRIVHPELQQQANEYVLIDGKGYIYRQDVALYEGCANYYDTTECNRLSRQFRRAWESSLSDPNLRQLKL